jgi:quinohemoprotein ethanol dehydrogenase
MAPDLRASFAVTSVEQFARIVRGGARSSRGMPAYADITDKDLAALQHYIRQQADRALPANP